MKSINQKYLIVEILTLSKPENKIFELLYLNMNFNEVKTFKFLFHGRIRIKYLSTSFLILDQEHIHQIKVATMDIEIQCQRLTLLQSKGLTSLIVFFPDSEKVEIFLETIFLNLNY